MFRRRTAVHLLLALALLLTQQALTVHAFAHLAARAAAGSDGGTLPHGKLCSLCVQAAKVADALPSSPVALPVEVTHQAPVGSSHSVFVPPLLLAFASRAPPASL